MNMRFYRKLAWLVAGCLVFGSIQFTGITAQASQVDGEAVTYAEHTAQETVTGNDSVGPEDVVTGNDSVGPEDVNSIAGNLSDDLNTANVEGAETYAAADLRAYGRWNNTPVELTDGKQVLSFSEENQEFCLDLPKVLDMSNCESITIRTADQNGGLAFKVYDSGKNQLKAYYENSGQSEYTFTPDFTGSAACIGVMANGSNNTYPFAAEIVSLTFMMKNVPPEDTPEDKTYPPESLKT